MLKRPAADADTIVEDLYVTISRAKSRMLLVGNEELCENLLNPILDTPSD